MYIFKCFIDFTKEENWLNEMAEKGLELQSASFGYTFKKSPPEKSIYKIDYRQFKSQKDFIDYCTLFEDSGWKHVCGSKRSGNQYFKKIDSNTDDDIFSDKYSKAGRYKRISNICFNLAMSYLSLLIILVSSNAININAFYNIKSLYYTPGLWEKTGLSFWNSFLFETPFALGRGFIWLLFPICALIYLYSSIKAAKLYKETIK